MPTSTRGLYRADAPAIWIRALLLWCLASVLPCAAAERGPLPEGEPSVVPADPVKAGRRYGVVWRLRGEALATDLRSSKSRKLRESDLVYVGERVHTVERSELVLLTDDGGAIALRPSTEFFAEAYAAEARNTDRMALRLLRGSLRIVTGWIGKLNRDGYSVATPAVTIGIRGTDHEPFVLSEQQAEATPYEAGSYDKVNRGRTVLKTVAGELEVEAGRVGFARQAGQAAPTDRALMTLLLPELLERVPGFYIGGTFEKELDEFSQNADENIRRRLEQAQAVPAGCAGEAAARDWIARFDSAVEQRDADAVLQMFAQDARIEAGVRDAQGQRVASSFSRKDFARSVRAAARGLEEYSQRRETLDVITRAAGDGQACAPVQLRSHVIEQGRLSGRPYRIEADEEYLLELREGRWLAVESRTTQR
ncbi:MAG TPA: FecR domain-containing protein [Solimonas sp.]|nr:FecR domain-containing protein [Solimonas sp.]